MDMSVQAPTSAAVAAQQLPDEVVWTLLLQQWQLLDQAVLCKLLCCSQAMADFVHKHCGGRLHVSMLSAQRLEPKFDSSAQVFQVIPADKWLAHYAMLLRQFEYQRQGDHQTDLLIAEGFAAAAAAAVCSDKHAGVLPLQRMLCDVPCGAHIVRALADTAPNLTSLWLCLAEEALHADSGLQHALAALTGLQDLTLGVPTRLHRRGDVVEGGHIQDWLAGIPQGLQQLTRLTALDLVPARHEVGDRPPYPLPVRDVHVQLFPASLVKLAVVAAGSYPDIRMGHLRAVTKLFIRNVMEGDILPPNAEVVTLCGPNSLKPLVKAPVHLRELSILNCWREPVSAGLPPLPNLHKVCLQFTARADSDVVDSWLAYLPSVPLQTLDIEWKGAQVISASAVAHLGSCTRLTRLCLSQIVSWEASVVQELVKQLPRLSFLQQLRLQTLYVPGQTNQSWQALPPALVKLTSLGDVELRGCSLGDAAAKLSGATQLTRLVLYDCGVDAATKAALCAGLPQLQGRREHCVEVCP